MIRKFSLPNTGFSSRAFPRKRPPILQTLSSEQFSDWDLSRMPGRCHELDAGLQDHRCGKHSKPGSTPVHEHHPQPGGPVGRHGANHCRVRAERDFELVVQLPGVDDPTRVKDIIQSTALLELKLVQDGPFSSRESALAAHGGVLPPDTQLLPGPNRTERRDLVRGQPRGGGYRAGPERG